MKYYILFILALFSVTFACAQTAGTPPVQFASKLQVSNVTGSNPYVIDATVDDCLSRFTSNSIAVGDSIYMIEGSDLIILVVTGTPSVSLGVATFTALDVDSTGVVPGGGQAAIVRPTSNYAFPSYICGLRDDLQQMIDARFKQRIDSRIATISAGLDFDSDRTILRVPTVGANIGGSTISDFLNYFYFTPPTITCNLSPTTTVYEVGTSNAITISGATTNSGSATLSGGVLTRTVPASATVTSFGTGTSYSTGITFTPQQGGSGDYNLLAYSFQASQGWVKGAESGTATSTTRSISGVYPVLYGMSATDFTSTGNPYTGLTKLVEAEGDKTVTLTGTGYIYFLVPKTWSDWSLSSIIDHNGFNVTASFTATDINISSSGLTNNWTTQAYRMYKLNTTTTTSGNAYQFNR